MAANGTPVQREYVDSLTTDEEVQIAEDYLKEDYSNYYPNTPISRQIEIRDNLAWRAYEKRTSAEIEADNQRIEQEDLELAKQRKADLIERARGTHGDSVAEWLQQHMEPR